MIRRDTLRQVLRTFTWLQLVSAFIFLALAVYLTWESYRFEQDSTPGMGIVIDHATKEDDGKTWYSPIFEFEDDHGNVVTVHSRTSASRPQHHVGQQVQIRFVPGDPMDARLDGWLYIWGGPTIIAASSVLFLVGAAITRFVLPKLLIKRSQQATVESPFGDATQEA